VGEEVSAARAGRLVVSLPFDIRDLRRLRCASYGGKMEVLQRAGDCTDVGAQGPGKARGRGVQ